MGIATRDIKSINGNLETFAITGALNVLTLLVAAAIFISFAVTNIDAPSMPVESFGNNLG